MKTFNWTELGPHLYGLARDRGIENPLVSELDWPDGVISGVPDRIYHSLHYASNSALKAILVSPAYMLSRRGSKQTDSQREGTLVHDAVLEPELYRAKYKVLPRFHKGQNDETAIGNGYEGGKQAYAAFMKSIENDESRIISASDAAMTKGAIKAVEENEELRRLLWGSKARELMLVWTDEELGVRCKAKLDVWHEDTGMLVDLKTTKSIGTFEGDIMKFGYHIQDFMYRRGATLLEMSSNPDFVIAALERRGAFESELWYLSDRHRELARAQVFAAADLWRACHDSQNFPKRSGLRVAEDLKPWHVQDAEASIERAKEFTRILKGEA